MEFDILSRSVPAQQYFQCKSMAEVMQARTASIARSSQSDLTRQLIEGHTNCWSPQSATLFGDEEIGAAGLRQQGVAPFGVPSQHALGRGMKWHQARFAKFG